jgi:hypothetical protein
VESVAALACAVACAVASLEARAVWADNVFTLASPAPPHEATTACACGVPASEEKAPVCDVCAFAFPACVESNSHSSSERKDASASAPLKNSYEGTLHSRAAESESERRCACAGAYMPMWAAGGNPNAPELLGGTVGGAAAVAREETAAPRATAEDVVVAPSAVPGEAFRHGRKWSTSAPQTLWAYSRKPTCVSSWMVARFRPQMLVQIASRSWRSVREPVA